MSRLDFSVERLAKTESTLLALVAGLRDDVVAVAVDVVVARDVTSAVCACGGSGTLIANSELSMKSALLSRLKSAGSDTVTSSIGGDKRQSPNSNAFADDPATSMTSSLAS